MHLNRPSSYAYVLMFAGLCWPAAASAEPVLVEFVTADGASLVASGDLPEGPGWADEEETRKRVDDRERAIADARADLVATMSAAAAAHVTGQYRHFPLLRMEIDALDRLELESHPQVVAIHRDEQRRLLTDSSLAYVGASRWHEAGYVGDGTSVAVLDSGIRYWNGHFGTCPEPGAQGCRVLVFEGFATLAFGSGSTDPRFVAEQESHGTNVGGIVGDVAPGTGLLSLGVFAAYDPDPSTGFDGGVVANDGDVVEALDWVITHRDEYGIVAANMSLGSQVDPAQTGYCTGWMAGGYVAAFANTRDAGVLPVVATGNDFVKSAIAPPSCVASAVAVAAGYDDPAFGFECGTGPVVPGAVTCFSDTNALVDLVAPGNDLDAGGIYGLSGTSMAAPHVAGLVALYQARFATPPVWTVERMRVDAVPVTEVGPRQTYVHRYMRVGDHDAVLTYDSGAVLASDFEGMPIPDGSGIGLVVAGDVACESALCASDVAGFVYLDLTVVHEGTGDLVIELENPAGTVARHEIATDDELGVENVNSILGSQHLAGVFDALRGGPIAGTWTLRLADDTDGRRGTLHRAVLLVDSARTEIVATIGAPGIARPDEPFDVTVTIENEGNLDLEDARLSIELADAATGTVVDESAIELELPSTHGDVSTHEASLVAPQGSYVVRVTGELEPDLAPGLVSEPREVSVTYRTFASFEVDPPAPAPGQDAALTIISRGLVESQTWDFGDGTASSARSPTHAWTAPGEYEVRLHVSGPDGVSTTTRTVTVAEVVAAPLDVGGGGLDCSCRSAGPGAVAGDLLLIPLLVLLLACVRARPRSRSRVRALFLLLPFLPSCWDDGRPELPDAGVPEPGPWISLLDPVDPTIGDTTVYLMLSSDEEAVCDVALEFRRTQGDFTPATLAEPELARGVSAGPDGIELGLSWLTTHDVPEDAAEVQLRASISCGDEAAIPVVSSTFAVLNFFVVNPEAVLISEVSAADGNVPADINADYLELRNTTDETIPLDGWTVVAVSAGGGVTTSVLAGATLGPRERLVLAEAGSGIEGAHEVAEDLPWTVDSSGSVAVLATHERGVDFVRWGGSASAPPDGLSWTDDPPLPIPQTLTVLSRVSDDLDSDRASDFCVGRPTPGDASTECIARYEPSAVLITELDSQGTDDQVEIYNTTSETIDLGGWVVRWDCDDLGSGVIPLAGAEVGPRARLVLRDNGTAGNLVRGFLELGQNLNIDGLVPIALALQDPNGTVIDFLAGGGSRIRWVGWDEDEPTPMPGPRTTLSRRPGDPDTDSADDFCLTQVNLLESAPSCLEPMGIVLVISEVSVGRPDWIEVYNPGPDTVDLADVYVSYTAPYYGGSVGDFPLHGLLEPGEFAVLSERPLDTVPDAILTGRENIALAPEGDGTVALRDLWGFGIDFVMWGEPAGTPLWPTRWNGLGVDTHAESDTISIQRFPHDSPETDTRDDWCWAYPSPASPNATCE